MECDTSASVPGMRKLARWARGAKVAPRPETFGDQAIADTLFASPKEDVGTHGTPCAIAMLDREIN